MSSFLAENLKDVNMKHRPRSPNLNPSCNGTSIVIENL